MLRFLLSLAACLTLAVSASAARPGDFRVIGPGGGGAMFHPTISPHDPQTVLIACDMTGAYITHDGGQTWRMFNLRGVVRFFAFDPLEPKTMYAGVTGLWRSTDNGDTWNLVWPKPSTLRAVEMNSDHSDERLIAEPNPLGEIVALAIDPVDSRALYAAGRKDGTTSLFASHDAGGTWRKMVSLPEAPQRLWVIPGTVYAAGPHGITEVRGTLATPHPAPAGFTFTDVSGGFPATGAPVFYGVSERGAFVSCDGGASWAAIELPGSGAEVRAAAASLHHPESAYLSYGSLILDGKHWLGVARTRDSGRTWSLVWKEANTAAANVHDTWITASMGTYWGENPLALGVADQDANLCYGTDFGRAMRTTDGGANWDGVYSRRVPGGDWTTTGLDVTTNYGYHCDPFDSKRRFITYTDIGLFRSDDGGRSWDRSMNGVPQQWSNTAYWIEFDPQVRGLMWGVMSYTHDLPRPKMWRRQSALSFKGGVCRSEDGGRTWQPSNKGMPETAPTHILLDPTSPKNARVLYVAAFGRGVYKSSDGGRTWELKNNGITQKVPFAWRLARAADGALYVLIARRSEDGRIGDAGDGAVYRSVDGAATWSSVPLPAGVNGPNGLALDPRDPRRMYLAAWGRATGTHGEGGGIYLSTDAGQHWRVVLDRDRHVYDVTIDPRNANLLYASGFESSAWRSTDRGEHWTRIPGFNFKWGHRVIPDPEDPGKIYITTFGGSVWHGAVNGKDEAVDIVTPELQPER
ncbi:MAG: hypothetical protein ABSH32_10050 [Bryobacteraceae bacterium]|jgi:photosystem II stability/assembly factor-like uncharacterized protein